MSLLIWLRLSDSLCFVFSENKCDDDDDGVSLLIKWYLCLTDKILSFKSAIQVLDIYFLVSSLQNSPVVYTVCVCSGYLQPLQLKKIYFYICVFSC